MTQTVFADPEAPARADWRALAAELDLWAADGRTARFWWRDDDAVAPTPELDRLVALAEAHGAPLALAVIPADAQPALADALAAHPAVTVLLHGWSHANHARPPAKKCELGADRPADAVLAELAEGKRVLERLFGARALPVLVPPWNRIAPGVEARLAGLGIRGLSTYLPRRTAPPGVTRVNTHLDPVAWRDSSRFLGEAESLGMAVAHLRARRTGAADAEEPTGLLTHHRVMDAATWGFVARFLSVTRAHPAVRWVEAMELFGAGLFGEA